MRGIDALVVIGAGEAPPRDLAGKTVVCDELDRIEAPMVELVVQRLASAQPRAVLVTGGRALRRLLPMLPRTRRLRPFTLGVLTDDEARSWVSQRVPGAHVNALLARSGNHPLLTAHLLSAWSSDDSDPVDAAVRRAVDSCASFCVSVARQVRGGVESDLLDHLVTVGDAVRLADAARAVGVPRMTAAADVLAMLGVVRRVNVDGDRGLHASCGLINDWWIADRGLAT